MQKAQLSLVQQYRKIPDKLDCLYMETGGKFKTILFKINR